MDWRRKRVRWRIQIFDIFCDPSSTNSYTRLSRMSFQSMTCFRLLDSFSIKLCTIIRLLALGQEPAQAATGSTEREREMLFTSQCFLAAGIQGGKLTKCLFWHFDFFFVDFHWFFGFFCGVFFRLKHSKNCHNLTVIKTGADNDWRSVTSFFMRN